MLLKCKKVKSVAGCWQKCCIKINDKTWSNKSTVASPVSSGSTSGLAELLIFLEARGMTSICMDQFADCFWLCYQKQNQHNERGQARSQQVEVSLQHEWREVYQWGGKRRNSCMAALLRSRLNTHSELMDERARGQNATEQKGMRCESDVRLGLLISHLKDKWTVQTVKSMSKVWVLESILLLIWLS